MVEDFIGRTRNLRPREVLIPANIQREKVMVALRIPQHQAEYVTGVLVRHTLDQSNRLRPQKFVDDLAILSIALLAQ